MIGVAFNAGDRRDLSSFLRSDFLALDARRAPLPLSPGPLPLAASLFCAFASFTVDGLGDRLAAAEGVGDAAPGSAPAGETAGTSLVCAAAAGLAIFAADGSSVVTGFDDSSHAVPAARQSSVSTPTGSSSDRGRAARRGAEMPCPVARVIVPAPD